VKAKAKMYEIGVEDELQEFKCVCVCVCVCVYWGGY
jgi:hypothetical protein